MVPLTKLMMIDDCRNVRLQERLTAPSRMSGVCPRPSFPGPQEFFSDFIAAADSHSLNRHLSDAFLSKITEVKVKLMLFVRFHLFVCSLL